MKESESEKKSLEEVMGEMSDEKAQEFEEALAGDGIFTEDAEAVEGMRQAAEALGINPDLVAPEDDDKVQYVAKKNCKYCHGRGAVPVVMSPQNEKTFSRKQALPGRVTKRKRSLRSKLRKYPHPVRDEKGPTQPRRTVVQLVSQANESTNAQWDTRRPEPENYKKMNRALAFCRCIRAISA